MISLYKFFIEGRSVEKKDIIRNKYLMNAYKKKMNNYRIMTIGDIIRNKWKVGEDVYRYVVEFIKENKEVMLIANVVNKGITQIQIRGIDNKKFCPIGKQTSIPYGFGMLNPDFKYGDWIILCEGIADRDALIEINQNTMAILSDGLSIIQTNLIKNLTNKALIMYDNDDKGREGFYRDRRKLNSMGFEVRGFRYPDYVKDPGDLLEFRYRGKYFEAESYKDYLESYINHIIN